MLYKTGNFSLCSGIVKSLANALRQMNHYPVESTFLALRVQLPLDCLTSIRTVLQSTPNFLDQSRHVCSKYNTSSWRPKITLESHANYNHTLEARNFKVVQKSFWPLAVNKCLWYTVFTLL